MKKVLIISYFYPPCNLTAAQRIGSWEKYLSEHGFFPIVVTRNWSGKEFSEKERLERSGEEINVIRSDKSEIHYLPYNPSWRDYFFRRSDKNNLFQLMSKALTTIMLFLQNFTIRAIPYKNLYSHSKNILENDTSIEYLIISGNPFEQFSFGYHLKKQFPHLKWIADYRDEWTTSEITAFRGLKKQLWNFQRRSELKWVKNTALITANTNHAVRKLSSLHKKKTKKILNGFDFDNSKEAFHIPASNKLVIVHNGTLYPTQKLTVFAEGLKAIHVPENFIIELFFPGIKIMPKVAEEVEHILLDCPVKFTLTDRIPKQEVIELQERADVLLMVAHEGRKGIVGSKLYEYIGLEKNILLCPSDKDELEETLEKTNLGFIASSPEEVKLIIEKWIDHKIKGKTINKEPNKNEISKFTRRSQVKLLASYLNEL